MFVPPPNPPRQAISGVSIDINVEGSLEVTSSDTGLMKSVQEDDDEGLRVKVYDGDEIRNKHKTGVSEVLNGTGGGMGGSKGGVRLSIPPNLFGEAVQSAYGVKSGALSPPMSRTVHSTLRPTPPPNFKKPESAFADVEEMMTVAQNFPQYSLSALGERKAQQLNEKEGGGKGDIPVTQMFPDSSILDSEEEASNLFHSLPNVTKRFSSRLIYKGGEVGATEEDTSMDMVKVLNSLRGVEVPTLFLCKSGEFIFGGYAGAEWLYDDTPHGSPQSFLFSVTLDLKIPYVGRDRNLEMEKRHEEEGMNFTHEAMQAGDDYMMFGKDHGDFVLSGVYEREDGESGGLEDCQACMEGSFGIGLKKDSRAAKCLLAGSETFVVDSLEVYEITMGR